LSTAQRVKATRADNSAWISPFKTITRKRLRPQGGSEVFLLILRRRRPASRIARRPRRGTRPRPTTLRHGSRRCQISDSLVVHTRLTFSARGPLGPEPSLYVTACPTLSASMLVPSRALWWKNSSPRSPAMNPNPLSVISFVIVPCGITLVVVSKSQSFLRIPNKGPIDDTAPGVSRSHTFSRNEA